MLFIFTIGYRLAFLVLAALTLAAAIPLAFAWARILPDEPPPFEIEPAPVRASEGKTLPVAAQEARSNSKRDPIAFTLLVFVTLGYVVQFPGFPRHAALSWLNAVLPSIGPLRVFWGIQGLFGLLNVGAASYSIFKPNSLRVPLAAGAALVLLLGLLGPFLRAVLLATS